MAHLLTPHICALAGELFDQINRKQKLPLHDAQFYAAEIVLILEYLRTKQVRPRSYLLRHQATTVQTGAVANI